MCVCFFPYVHSLGWMVDLPWKQEECAQKEDIASTESLGFCLRLLVGKTYGF